MSAQRRLDDQSSGPPPAGTSLLEVAALFEGTTRVSGIGWRVTGPDGPGPIRTATRRYGRTLIFSELAALRGGLEEVARTGGPQLCVRSSSPVLASLFEDPPPPRYRRAALTAARLRPWLARFDAVRFEAVARPDPELGHAVGEALDLGLHRAAEIEEHRAMVMERIVARAAEVQLEERDGTWVANGRYRPRLDPMDCDCPAWSTRWARVPIAGRRAERLPCKHLVALAIRQGISVPADLAHLARRAPP